MTKEIHINMKRLLVCAVIFVFIMSLVGAGVLMQKPRVLANEITISNPRMIEDSTMSSGQKVTWDCVWFGDYPQTEVITTEMLENSSNHIQRYEKLGAVSWYSLFAEHALVSDALYEKLQKSASWDENDDTTIDGIRYHRITKEDAQHVTKLENSTLCYRWSDDITYHYFKYEPIKWRVLSVDDSYMLLLSDVILDCQAFYMASSYPAQWSDSTIRSWLNGYEAKENAYWLDYTSDNFIDRAFNATEQAMVKNTELKNVGNLQYTSGPPTMKDTVDKIFLLSESEVYTDTAVSYGFTESRSVYDEARISYSSIYAKAMGTYLIANDWWLRSQGGISSFKAHVSEYGEVSSNGTKQDFTENMGIRPALYLDVNANDLYSYAGVVCSDGTDTEVGGIIKPSHNHSYNGEWKYDNDEHWKSCECGAIDMMEEHVWDEGSITKEATATDKGEMLFTCNICKMTKTEDIPLLEEKPGDLVNEKVDIRYMNIAEIDNLFYCGEAITPSVTMTGDKGKLLEGRDYSVCYENNINVGEAKIIIQGCGEYIGKRIITFQIAPFDASELSTTLKGKDGQIYRATYNKKAIKLKTAFKIATTNNGKKVYLQPKEGIDYSVRFQNNKKIGTASIIYTFKGNYQGTLTKNFQIVPPKTKVTSVKKRGSKIVLKWKKISSCDRYEVYRANAKNGTYNKIATVKGKKKCTYTDKKAKKGKKYYYKVKTCKKVKGKIYKSDFSNVKKGKR